MTILNININDFGGTNHHIEEFKNKYGKRWYISRWDELDKTKEALILAKTNEKQKQEELDKDMFSSAFKKSKEKARKSRKNKSEKKNAKEDK